MVKAEKTKTKLKYRLVHTAQTLFSRDGYERTTVDAIITETGVSKGGFYYHFPSKTAILDAVIDFITEDIGGILPIRLNHAGTSPILKMTECITTLRLWQLQTAMDLSNGSHLYFPPENALMRERIKFMTAQRVTPILSKLIQQGIDAGLFVEGKAESIAMYALYLIEDSTEMHLRSFSDAQTNSNMINSFCLNENDFRGVIERMLGLDDGSIERVRPDTIPQIAKLLEK